MSLLEPRLEKSSSWVMDLTLCQIRLSHNASFPWILLIPKDKYVTEIIDLPPHEQHLLIEEIAKASHVMKTLFNPHKLNIASLGNVVPQLHVHIIARYENDPVWPNPVWNTVKAEYDEAQKNDLILKLKEGFGQR
jgi:diadenosine tetraphosphate (Ap4A) HIT family hydrolase